MFSISKDPHGSQVVVSLIKSWMKNQRMGNMWMSNALEWAKMRVDAKIRLKWALLWDTWLIMMKVKLY